MRACPRVVRGAAACRVAAPISGAGADPCQHGVDQPGLDADRPARSGASAANRSTGPMIAWRPASTDRCSSCRRFASRPGSRRLKVSRRASASSRIATQDVDGKLGPGHELGERVAERGVAPVVDEVLLDLVEQQVDLVVLGRGDLDRVGERARARSRPRRRQPRRAPPQERPTRCRRPRRAAPRGGRAGRARRPRARSSSCRRRSGRTGRSSARPRRSRR